MSNVTPEFYGDTGRQVARMYVEDRLSTYSIARQLKITQGKVRRILEALDIPRRNCAEHLNKTVNTIERPVVATMGSVEIDRLYHGRSYG